MSKIIYTCFLGLLIVCQAYSQEAVIGQWKTVDDETGEKKSVVEIFRKGDKVFGKIVKITNKEKQDVVCDQCDDDDPRKNQKILGMEIIKDMEKNGDEWDGGTILDPQNGKVYKCKIWIEDNNLIVRGYIGFSWIGRSQTWLKDN